MAKESNTGFNDKACRCERYTNFKGYNKPSNTPKQSIRSVIDHIDISTRFRVTDKGLQQKTLTGRVYPSVKKKSGYQALIVITLLAVTSLLTITAPAQLLVQETFENPRYCLISGGPLQEMHSRENCIPNDTANGSPYDSTLIRVHRDTLPVFRGNRALQMTVWKGQPLVGTAQRYRSEIVAIKPSDSPGATFPANGNVWYSFAVLFPTNGSEYDPSVRTLINQWFEDANKDNTIKIDQGKVYFEATPNTGSTAQLRYDLFGQTITNPQSNNVGNMVPMPKDEWHEFVFHIKHHLTAGFVDIYRDGKLIHQITGKTMHLMFPKWKMGVYSAYLDLSIRNYRKIFFDNIRVADSTATLATMMSTTVANIAPTASAGADVAITLPTSSTSFSGSGNDADGTISSYAWTQQSGPITATITTPTTAGTGVTGLSSAGTYIFRLTVTDNNGGTGSDDVTVLVNPAVAISNVLPVTTVTTPDTTVQLPVDGVDLTGTATDSDGSITEVLWLKTSGPDIYTITGGTTLTPIVSGLAEGVYVFTLYATDDDGATTEDSVTITVLAATSIPNPSAVRKPRKVLNARDGVLY